MSTFHANDIVTVLNLVGNVHNRNMLTKEGLTVSEQATCLEDIKDARNMLNTIIQDEEDKL